MHCGDERGLFPSGYFSSAEWQAVEDALVPISQACSTEQLWEAMHPHQSIDQADMEPVLTQLLTETLFEDLFTRTIPFMADLVHQAPLLFADSNPMLLTAGWSGRVALSRRQVACLLSMMAVGLGIPKVHLARRNEDADAFPCPLMAPLLWPKARCDFPPNGVLLMLSLRLCYVVLLRLCCVVLLGLCCAWL